MRRSRSFAVCPPTCPWPILFVLHISAQFGYAFADWLNTQTPWRARFPRDGEHLSDAVGSIILAPARPAHGAAR